MFSLNNYLTHRGGSGTTPPPPSTPAVRVQYAFSDKNAPPSNSLPYPANNTAGNLLVCFVMGYNNFNPDTCIDSNSNTWNYAGTMQVNPVTGNVINVYYAYNCNAGANTVSFTGPISALNCVILEYSGVKNTADPFISPIGGNTGNGNPLQGSLTFGVDCLVLMQWYNNNTDDYTGLTAGLSLIDHNVDFGYNYFTVAEILQQLASGSPKNVGIASAGSSTDNVTACIAFELA